MSSQFKTRAHLYVGDGITDHKGLDRCSACGLVKTHKLHNLPKTDPAVVDLESRRLGEKRASR